jgi:osmotically inducible lipoprotein OsmB
MKTKIIAAALAAASLIGLAGCAGMDRETADTVGGAAIGGVAGSALTGGSAVGTVGGAALGGYIGNNAAKR